MIPIQDTVIFKHCLMIIQEYQALQKHDYTESFTNSINNAIEQLSLTVDETEDGQIHVGFTISQKEVNHA